MYEPARARILQTLDDDALVLDIGGWAKPFTRADWVLDVESYDTRGQWGTDGDPAEERFTRETWVQRDICDHEPWPFGDDQFDFVVCAQTLEDVRDPIWTCREIARVGRAGYIEVPSRLVEQTWNVQGDWVGYGHHHWLIDIDADRAHIDFVFKPHVLPRRDRPCTLPAWVSGDIRDEERISQLWWQGAFTASERLIFDPYELQDYLEEVLRAHPGRTAQHPPDQRRRWRR